MVLVERTFKEEKHMNKIRLGFGDVVIGEEVVIKLRSLVGT